MAWRQFVVGAALLCTAASAAPISERRAAILDYLHALPHRHQTLAGVQVNEYEVYINCDSFDRVVAQTGRPPAILGLELMNVIAYPPYEAYLTDRALTQTAAGGLVEMSWHERNPVEVCPRGEFYDCVKKPMTAATFHAVLTPGTPEHALWLADVDAVARVLGRLQERAIVVLFRPYHEMNGGWFWWGKQPEYPQLWDALYDELTVKRKLDNLIWVWSAGADKPYPAPYFPVRHFPDVIGFDIYERDPDSPKYLSGRDQVTALAPSTAFALTEVGVVPSAKVLDATNPSWVLLWGGEYLNKDWASGDCDACNDPKQVSAFFRLPRVVTRDEMPAPLRETVAAGVANEHPLHAAKAVCPAKLP